MIEARPAKDDRELRQILDLQRANLARNLSAARPPRKAHEIGTLIKYSLRAYLTASGDLIATEVASGSTLDELDASVRKAGGSIFSGVH